MAQPKFKVEYEDGQVEEVAFSPKHQLRYEAETKKSLLGDVNRITDLYEMVWYAKGKPGNNLGDFFDRVVDITPLGSEEDADEERPTSPSNLPD